MRVEILHATLVSSMIETTGCMLQDLAELLRSEHCVKALWLDVARDRVTVATGPGGGRAQPTMEKMAQLIEQRCMGINRYEAAPCWQHALKGCGRTQSLSMPGGIRLVSMPEAGIMLEKESCPTGARFWKWHELPLRVKPREKVRKEAESPTEEDSEWKHGLALAGVCAVFTLLGAGIGRWAPESWGGIVSVICYIAAYISGGMHPAEEVWGLLKKRVLDVHFLMLAVAVGAAVIGHWWEGAVLLFLFSFSGALEELAEARTQREIRSLFKDAPKEAVRIDEQGNEYPTPVEELQAGMLLRVRPGEQFAVDGEIIRGTSAANEANLTGEALPVDKEVGSRVYGGTLNLWGSIDYRVTRPASDSALAKIIRLIKEARESKAPSQRFTDHFGTAYTYGILGLSIAMFLVWWLAMGVPAFTSSAHGNSSFYRAMTLLVVASPCALVLSIPSAILAGIAAGARRGVLFRGGAAIERLAEADRFAFDKTGTLTTGELKVEDVEVANGSREDLLRVAAALAHHSAHPVSRALARHYVEQDGGDLPETDDFRDLAGNGVEGTLDGQQARLGRRSLFADALTAQYPDPAPGETEVFVQGGGVFGRVLLKDELREAAGGLLRGLRARKRRLAMLTGDRAEAAENVAQRLELDEVHAGLKPEDKVALIQKWSKEGEKVVMVGDGVNDAPSFAAADLAVGMGMRGADASLEQADVVLMRDKLEKLAFAFELSRRARRIIKQNLAISLGVILVLVAAALGAKIPLTLGVVGHEGSTVIVVLNSLRLLFGRGE